VFLEMLNKILADHTEQSITKLRKDTDRDFFLDAEEAKKYGLVDEILTKPATDDPDPE